jgi:hypothetical protein
MAVALSDGTIYFLESKAATNQDWVTAGGATFVDLTNFTEGTEYCKLSLPSYFKKGWGTGMEIINSGGGNSFQLRYNRRNYFLDFRGFETSVANADKVEQFFMHDNHTASSSSTYVDYYCIIRFTSTIFVNFTDQGGTRRDYCKGASSPGGFSEWNQDTPSIMALSFAFKSLW